MPVSLSIPISGLNPLNVVTSSDFIPVVQSSSLTTFRTPLTVLGNWISSSVNASSSFSSISASKAYSSSYACSSSFAITSNNLNYPNLSTASYAISSSQTINAINSNYAITASFAISTITGSSAISSSWSSQSFWATSASFASQSIWSISSSFASRSLVATSASWASQSIWATSASFASRSISSSYSFTTTTASYALGNMIRAFGTVLMKTANDYTSIIISSASFNLKPTVIWGGSGAGAVIDPDTWSPPLGLGISTLRVNLPGNAMYISFVAPMPTRYYTVLCTYNGYEPYGYETIQTWTSPVGQTLTGFTMSFAGGDNSSTEGKFITNFMVLHP
jgi:hypothetical protein